MTQSEVIRAYDGVTKSQSGSLAHRYGLNWPKTGPAKIIPKIACFALSGDPRALTLVTNHSNFFN